MALGAENEQAACGGNFVVLFVGLGFVACERLIPLLGRDHVFVTGVIPDSAGGIVHADLNLALRCTQKLRDSFLHALLLGHEFGVAAEKNVGSPASHVGGDRDHALASGLGDDFRFFFVILGIQHHVLDAFLLQQVGKALGLYDRRGAEQHRLSRIIQLLNFIGRCEVFFFLSAINQIRILDSQ